MIKRKTILVTGGAGYIGSAISQALLEDEYNIIILDDLSTGQNNQVRAGAKFIPGDILDTEILDQLFSEQSIDVVIHCAGKKAVGESEKDPYKYFSNNVIGTLNLLETMAKYQVPKLIFSSTASVYQIQAQPNPIEGDFKRALTEEAPLQPVSVYGETKLMAERLIQNYARLGLLPHFVILRYFNVAGDAGLNYLEDKAENIFPILARALSENKPFNIFGNDYSTKDGTGVRDYIHLNDLVSAHHHALAYEGQAIFNLGTKNGYSVRELISAFERLSGKTIKVIVAPRRPGDPACVIADATKVEFELNWRPKYDLDDMVRSILKVYNLPTLTN